MDGKGLNEMSDLRTDLKKYYTIEHGTSHPTFRKRLRTCIMQFGLHCVVIYRFGRFARRLCRKNFLIGFPFAFLHSLLNYLMRLLHHVDIDEAEVGPGFYVGHVGTIYLGPSTIGRNFSIHHNVTVGVGHSKGKTGIPVIGDDVWIATGSVLAGAITIGNGVTISSGSIVTRSVPDRCFVAGNPARVLLQNYDNSALFGIRDQASQSAPEHNFEPSTSAGDSPSKT
jgi:serine O-acetyltransferase